MPVVAVVDYGLTNLRSVINALNCFTERVEVAEKGEDLDAAEVIVLPGVGNFGAGMRALRERDFVPWLERLVIDRGKPFLGICLGLQFLFEESEEGTGAGLGWLPGKVRRFREDDGLKVPHMGWSETVPLGGEGLFAGFDEAMDFYYVHGYYVPFDGAAKDHAAATCEYGKTFVAAVEKDNIRATQFHPEKSQLAGMKLLETFLAGAGACQSTD